VKFQVLGVWFAVEIVQHREDTKMPRGTIVVDTCPRVHLSIHDPKRDMISLIWDEAAGTIQYTFHVVDMERPGFWLSTGAQNGEKYFLLLETNKVNLYFFSVLIKV
jgi:hypothetical protein